jgi:undecaprenyl-diphosphatase
MIELIPILFLSLIQGITEFLPVSSSAHLILVPIILNWDDQGIAMDIAVHVGTLFAVVFYFRKDIFYLIWGLIRKIQNKPSKQYSPLAINLIYASLPIAVIGFLAHDFVSDNLRSPLVVAIATIVFGILLGLADIFSKKTKNLLHMGSFSSIAIGFSQVLALIPGTSRSGITLTAGLALGFNRKVAAKFSFLLSIPAILMAGGYESLKIINSPSHFAPSIFIFAIVCSFLSAYACVSIFMSWFSKIGVWPFVIYRLLLGAGLIWFFT